MEVTEEKKVIIDEDIVEADFEEEELILDTQLEEDEEVEEENIKVDEGEINDETTI